MKLPNMDKYINSPYKCKALKDMVEIIGADFTRLKFIIRHDSDIDGEVFTISYHVDDINKDALISKRRKSRMMFKKDILNE